MKIYHQGNTVFSCKKVLSNIIEFILNEHKNTLETFIYKGQKKQNSYLFVVQRDDFSRVPVDLLAALGKLEFVMQLELTAGRKLAISDPEKVMQHLHKQGFYLQMPDESDKLPLAGKAPPSNTIPEL